MEILYKGLENPWPYDQDLTPLFENLDYRRIRSPTCDVIFITPEVPPGDYDTFTVVDYIKIPLHYEPIDIIAMYPQLSTWVQEWPRSVGRYYPDTFTVVDLIFGKATSPPDFPDTSSKHLREAPVDPTWSEEQRTQWLSGHHGVWQGWTYDLLSASLAELVMGYVNEIEPRLRTPYRVVRHLLSCIDIQNRPDALVHSDWSGDYSRSLSPSHWVSTRHVCTERRLNKLPVQFTQCWINAEVMTSACRLMGIPARTVYAKNARVDKHCDGGVDFGLKVSKDDTFIPPTSAEIAELILAMSITKGEGENKSYPSESEPETDLCAVVGLDDGVWNFHLWTEVYISRPDLPNYTTPGWQAVDPSPVVESDSDPYRSNYILGPCPVSAIRNRDPVNHDFKYLYSAVNSVYRYWKCVDDVYYVDQIRYPHELCDKVTLHTQLGMDKINLTATYTPEPDPSYYIQSHPFLFYMKHNLVAVKPHRYVPDTYFVQICGLSKSRLVSCLRVTLDHPDQLHIPECPVTVTRFSIITLNTTTKQWWIQLLDV